MFSLCLGQRDRIAYKSIALVLATYAAASARYAMSQHARPASRLTTPVFSKLGRMRAKLPPEWMRSFALPVQAKPRRHKPAK